MWFGTNLGVARHDGIHFKVFRRANTLPDPLSNDYVLAITQDEAGDLWLGTRKGLNRFHYASETFSVHASRPQGPGIAERRCHQPPVLVEFAARLSLGGDG